MQTLTVYNQHVLQALKQIPDNSVDCIITSPPYYGLRSYKGADTIWGGDPNCEHDFEIREHHTQGQSDKATTESPIKGLEKNWKEGFCSKCGAWKGQLGLEPTYQMYIDHLLTVTAELKRILKPSGTLFWNMGDSYAGKMGKRQGWNDNKISYTREEALENGTTFYLNADYGNIQNKSLMMIPERFAIAMIDQGWILRNKIIWFKRNGIPTSTKDRLANKWEYIFFFVKSKKYFFNLDTIRKPLADPDRMLRGVSGKRYSQSEAIEAFFGNPHHGINKPRPNVKHNMNLNIENYLSKGANPGDVINTPAIRYKSWYSNPGHKFTHEREYDPNADGSDFWDIPTKPHTFAHFAVFPETLVEPLIKAGCPQNGVVLDPFAGSGTTLLVALNHGLDAIGIEISKEYIPIIETRTNAKERQKLGTLDYRLIV